VESEPATPDAWLTVAGILRHWATLRPDAPMLTCGSATMTWSECYRRARQVAASLVAGGIGPGDRVAFLDRNGTEFFEVLFGCALAGAVTVVVNWRLSPAEMTTIVADAEAVVLFFGPDYATAADEITSRAEMLRQAVPLDALPAWRAHSGDDPDDPQASDGPGEVVLQLYTSGTTGLPKGAMLTNANISAVLVEAERVFRIGPDTVSMIAMPLFHIGGSGWALAGMSRGGHSVIIRDVDPTVILDAVERHGITETFVVPAVLSLLLAAPAIATTDVSSLRTVFYGASPISEDLLVRSLRALRCDFVQVYGLTETTGAITALLPEDHDPDGPRAQLLRSAGRPFDHVELAIVETGSRRHVPTGEVGEVWTRSSQNMLGYWHKPAETAAVLDADGWFHTGDAGWIDAEGYLFLHDRIKDMIVSGGENVYPAEVENAVLAHPAVADAAVIGVPDPKWGETVKAIVVATSDAPADREALAADIIAATRERLAHFKCPTSVDFAEALPRNPSGKILKRELRAPYWEGRDRQVH